MVRFTIEKAPIMITYGYNKDDDKGIFLTVSDQRLACDATALEEVNRVLQRFDNTKSGAYLKLYTGTASDSGIKVSVDTITTYMRRYGVPREHINDIVKENSTPKKEM